MIEELKVIKEHVQKIKKWIEVAKKRKCKEITTIPTPTIINMTLEEEQRRKE